MNIKRFPTQNLQKKIKSLKIDKNKPWGFFDEASQGEPQLGGARGILYLN